MPSLINYWVYGIVSILAVARGQKTGKRDSPRKKGAVVKPQGQEAEWPRLGSALCFSKSVQPSERVPSHSTWDLWRGPALSGVLVGAWQQGDCPARPGLANWIKEK